MKRRFRHGRAGVGVGFHAKRTYGAVTVVPTFIYSLDFTDDRNLMYFPVIF